MAYIADIGNRQTCFGSYFYVRMHQTDCRERGCFETLRTYKGQPKMYPTIPISLGLSNYRGPLSERPRHDKK